MEVYFCQATELLPNAYVVCRMVMFSLMSVRGEGGLQMTTTHDLFKLVHLLHPDLFKLACLRTPHRQPPHLHPRTCQQVGGWPSTEMPSCSICFSTIYNIRGVFCHLHHTKQLCTTRKSSFFSKMKRFLSN